MRSAKFPGFPPEALVFLAALRKHNIRVWFQARKETYERAIKSPMTELILSIGEAFRGFAPEMVADPRVSFYRIYRDTRFSRDKSPYKTQAAAVFPVRGLPKNSGPGLYFHISPDEVLMGGGIYMPEPRLLRAVRQRIAEKPEEFFSILQANKFRRTFGDLEGEQLKSMPKGFSADHVAARYLRYKQFLFGNVHPSPLATSRRLLPTLLTCFETGMPLIRFLREAAMQAISGADRLEAFSSSKWK
ncbi:MAG: DUF2461 domain-containing protein [Acidobacteria bacterium]|nr:DUF2461 domain-containing protein [Acidobacteriota bacterium]